MEYVIDDACAGMQIEVDDLVLIGLREYRVLTIGDSDRTTITLECERLDAPGVIEYPVVKASDYYELLTQVSNS